jgi:flagellar biogenesis protein FliO
MLSLAGILVCACLVKPGSDSNASASPPAPEVQSLLNATEDSLAKAWDALEPNLAAGGATPIERPEEKQFLRRDKPAAAAASSGSWLRTIGSLAAVVALIVLLGWGYRTAAGKGQGLGGARPKQHGVIEVLGRTAVSARQSVCLLRVGPRLILVGSSGDRLAPLDAFENAELAARLSGDAATGRPDSRSSDFSRSLEGAERELAQADRELDETAAPEESRLSALRGALESATERLRALRERI